MITPNDLRELAERRRRIQHIANTADKMARRMGGRFVIEPWRLRQYVRYLRARAAS